ncbi:MAG: hypothetical protein ACR2L2_09020, partial [Acidobacteriota bacterium]
FLFTLSRLLAASLFFCVASILLSLHCQRGASRPVGWIIWRLATLVAAPKAALGLGAFVFV